MILAEGPAVIEKVPVETMTIPCQGIGLIHQDRARHQVVKSGQERRRSAAIRGAVDLCLPAQVLGNGQDQFSR